MPKGGRPQLERDLEIVQIGTTVSRGYIFAIRYLFICHLFIFFICHLLILFICSFLKEITMSSRDIIGLVLSYIYAFGLLFGMEAVGKRWGWPQRVTRKLVHIGAGMWIWGILYFFDHRIYGLIPFATFIILNYIFYRQQSFKATDTADSSPGTVYFAFSITVLFGLLWQPAGPLDRIPLAAAAVMAMTWGDAFASLIGHPWGRHTYTVFKHQRSWEGTAAMALFSFLGIFLTLLVLPGSALSPHSPALALSTILSLALGGTLVATAAEGCSPAGTDNLSVPLLTGLALYLLSGLL